MIDKVVSKGKDGATHDCSAAAPSALLRCRRDGSPPPGASLCWLEAKTRCVRGSIKLPIKTWKRCRRGFGTAFCIHHYLVILCATIVAIKRGSCGFCGCFIQCICSLGKEKGRSTESRFLRMAGERRKTDKLLLDQMFSLSWASSGATANNASYRLPQNKYISQNKTKQAGVLVLAICQQLDEPLNASVWCWTDRTTSSRCSQLHWLTLHTRSLKGNMEGQWVKSYSRPCQGFYSMLKWSNHSQVVSFL